MPSRLSLLQGTLPLIGHHFGISYTNPLAFALPESPNWQKKKTKKKQNASSYIYIKMLT